MNQFDALDFSTKEGARIKGMLEELLKNKRAENDNAEMLPLETAVLRGEIRLIKRLLQPPAPVVKSPGYHADLYGGNKT